MDLQKRKSSAKESRKHHESFKDHPKATDQRKIGCRLKLFPTQFVQRFEFLGHVRLVVSSLMSSPSIINPTGSIVSASSSSNTPGQSEEFKTQEIAAASESQSGSKDVVQVKQEAVENTSPQKSQARPKALSSGPQTAQQLMSQVHQLYFQLTHPGEYPPFSLLPPPSKSRSRRLTQTLRPMK